IGSSTGTERTPKSAPVKPSPNAVSSSTSTSVGRKSRKLTPVVEVPDEASTPTPASTVVTKGAGRGLRTPTVGSGGGGAGDGGFGGGGGESGGRGAMSTPQTPYQKPMKIRVVMKNPKNEDEVFAVPVPRLMSTDSVQPPGTPKTIGWLWDEAVRRYQKIYRVKPPVFKLVTRDKETDEPETLALDDFVEDLLEDGGRVFGVL
ncbi:hypothetical protein HDV00_003419, partial [Rhizophlyctis rosea]